MENNEKIIEELKSGNVNRINFFKERIKEELKRLNTTFDDDIVNKILNTAIETCDENIKIPFLFHLKIVTKNMITKRKDIDTGIFTKLEYNIIKLYLNKENDQYLSRGVIADRLSVNINEVLKTIDKLEEDNEEIEKVLVLAQKLWESK